MKAFNLSRLPVWVSLGWFAISILSCPGQNGLRGEYFDNTDFTGTQVTRIDPFIDFDWGEGSPIAGIGNETFSVRWTGEVMPRFSGVYTFTTTGDDGVRLWVNGQRIINGWSPRLRTTDTGTILLKGETRYLIQLEFFDQTVAAVVSLAWSGPGQPFEIIPQSQLFAPVDGANRPPNTPLIYAPEANGLSVDPADFAMRTDVFSDPDTGNAHSCTEWEIWRTDAPERIWFASCSSPTNFLTARLTDGVFENSHSGRTALQLQQRLPFARASQGQQRFGK